MSTRHNWRRRRQAAPFFLQIVDHDTKRFTIEGPVESENAWMIEISRAQKAGRKLGCSRIEEEELGRLLDSREPKPGYEYWPPQSIITPRGL
jgi:hypothetical protein